MPPPTTLQDIQTRVDNWVTANWSTIAQIQEDYFTAHGTYWQGLITHSVRPKHSKNGAAPTAADLLDSHPTDQAETWLDVYPQLNGVQLDFALEVVCYEGPLGFGWDGKFQMDWDTGTEVQTWGKIWQYGPETWRARDWYRLIEDTL